MFDRSIWRIVSDGQGDAAWNMAADEAIFNAVVANSAPPTLRLYQWSEYAITVGRFQNTPRTLDLEACAAYSIPVVRRMTGGRGILHGEDLTVSLVASIQALGLKEGAVSAVALYRCTAELFIGALDSLGIEATMGDGDRRRGQDKLGNCFDIVCQADIVDRVTGAKRVGAAVYRSGNYLLLQASVPLGSGSSDLDRAALETGSSAATAGDEIEAIRQSVFCQSCDDGDRIIPALGLQDLRDSLIKRLQMHFASEVWFSGLSHSERNAAAILVTSRYDSEDWNRWGRLPGCG